MGMVAKRFEVWLTKLDPVIGKEIKKSRPCVIISPDDMNNYLGTVILAPMTSKMKNYPSRVNCRFKGINGEVVLDQIKTADKTRLIKKLGLVNEDTQFQIIECLQEIFSF
jgi:mRNA interferase MazF